MSSAERAAALPDMPTISEQRLPRLHRCSRGGDGCAGKTPRPIVNRLNADVNRILSQPEVKQSFLAAGTEPMVMTLEQLDQFVKAESAKWGKAVKRVRAQRWT